MLLLKTSTLNTNILILIIIYLNSRKSSILYGEVSRVNAPSDCKIMGGKTWDIMGWQKG